MSAIPQNPEQLMELVKMPVDVSYKIEVSHSDVFED
jgi:hypothetical protein